MTKRSHSLPPTNLPLTWHTPNSLFQTPRCRLANVRLNHDHPPLPTLSAPIPNLDCKQWKASRCTTTPCVQTYDDDRDDQKGYISLGKRVFCSSPLNWITDLVFQPSNSFKSSIPLLNITHVLSKHAKKLSADWSVLPSEHAYIHILLCWVKWVTCEWYPLDCYDCYKEQRCQIQSNN